MKKLFKTGLVLAFSAVTFMACESTEDQTYQTTEEIEADMDDAGDDWENERDEFVRESEQRMERIDARIERLEEDMEGESAEVKAENREKINELKRERDELKETMDRAGDSTKDNWKEFKGDVSNGFDQLERDLDETFGNDND